MSNIKKWVFVLLLLGMHPILLSLLFPLVGERSNLVVVIAPMAATWLFSWRVGIPVALVNVIATAVVFTIVGNRGAEGQLTGIAVFVVLSVICIVVDLGKRFLAKGKAMEEELERLRRS